MFSLVDTTTPWINTKRKAFLPLRQGFVILAACRLNATWSVSGGSFFLACEYFGRMFHHSFPAYAFFFFGGGSGE